MDLYSDFLIVPEKTTFMLDCTPIVKQKLIIGAINIQFYYREIKLW